MRQPKMPKQYDTTEATKNALAKAPDEKARIAALKMADALAAGTKKSIKKPKHG
jgi:hypothetical protein